MAAIEARDKDGNPVIIVGRAKRRFNADQQTYTASNGLTILEGNRKGNEEHAEERIIRLGEEAGYIDYDKPNISKQ